FAAFIADGGYASPLLWSPAGLEWIEASKGDGDDGSDDAVGHPGNWQAEGDGTWSRLRFGRIEEVPADEPVQHICFHEAEAFEKWSGKRLPTEVEWEYAASNGNEKTSWPWGEDTPARSRANLGAG